METNLSSGHLVDPSAGAGVGHPADYPAIPLTPALLQSAVPGAKAVGAVLGPGAKAVGEVLGPGAKAVGAVLGVDFARPTVPGAVAVSYPTALEAGKGLSVNLAAVPSAVRALLRPVGHAMGAGMHQVGLCYGVYSHVPTLRPFHRSGGVQEVFLRPWEFAVGCCYLETVAVAALLGQHF